MRVSSAPYVVSAADVRRRAGVNGSAGTRQICGRSSSFSRLSSSFERLSDDGRS